MEIKKNKKKHRIYYNKAKSLIFS